MGLVVIVVYIIIGSLLIFTDFFTIVPDEYRLLIGIVVLLYGAFRATRLMTKNSNSDSE